MKKCLLIFLLLLSDYTLRGQTAGYTKVDVAVGDNGEANANIPLNLPKGTILQPSLGISYSSQGNNGLLGLGFNLSGVSQTITRVPMTLAQDGQIDPVDFDSLDRFAWNGERLVALAGTYGANNTEYRTEQNSFAKIISYGTGMYGPDKFIVYTKDGLILYFGYTADSRIEASGTVNKPLIWLLNRIEDRKGNYLTITYTEENADGAFRPDEINYSGNTNTGLLPYNKIKFIYETRPDQSSKTLLGGYISKLNYRLKTIQVFDHSQIHRRYELEYDATYFTVSKLKKVTEYGIDNTTYLNPVEITWNPDVATKGFTKAGSGAWAIPNGHNNRDNFPPHIEGDYNGDGKVDFLSRSWDLGIKRCLSTGSSFSGLDTPLDGSTGNFDKPPFGSLSFFGDFDGNGSTDFGNYTVYDNSGGGGGAGRIAATNGAGTTGIEFEYYHYINNTLYGGVFWDLADLGTSLDMLPLTGDYNGDGKTDILVSIGNYYRSNNGIIVTDPSFLPQNAIPNSRRTGDFNADGRTDFIQAFNSGGTKIWRVALSTGTSFNFQPWTAGPTTDVDKVQTGDFNGDGMTDFMMPDLSGSSGPNQWYIYLSTGAGFTQMTVNGPVYTSTDKHYALDINSDGLTDLVGKAAASTNITVALSNGSNITVSPFLSMPSQMSNFDNMIWGDFDGDGKNDWAHQVNSTQWDVNLNNIPKDFVTQIKNGNGATFKFEYKPITDASVYTKGTAATYPLMDFQGAFHVVSKFSIDNGIGGEHKTYYKYAGALIDHKGRGFRGFSSRTIIDSLALSKTILTYDRDFRKVNASLIKSEKRTIPTNKLVYLVENTPKIDSISTTSPKIYFSYYPQTKESQYELNTKLIRSKQTNFVFDNYANPTSITEVSNDGYTIATTNTYTDDVSNWRLGRVTATTVTKTRVGKTAITKNSIFAYDAAGHLIQDILLPTNLTRKVQHDYVLDAYGNTTSLTTSGSGITTRTEITTYDSEGRNIVSAKNALNHTTTYAYTRGYVSSTTDPNGLTTSVVRDVFGREIQTTFPDATTHNVSYTKCSSYPICGDLGVGCPTLSIYYTTELTTGKGFIKTYFDKVDRAIRTEKQGFDGSVIIVDKIYNGLGLVASQSDPHGDCIIPYYTTTEYDTLQRPIKITQPGGRITQINYTTALVGSYDRSLTKTTNPQNQQKEQAIDSQGKIIYVKDHYGSWLYYDYDSDLNIIQVTHDNASKSKNTTQIDAKYDIRGFKTYMKDYDMGEYYYENNSLGLLTQQTNPKSQISIHSYDLLNRPIQRVEPEGTSTWEYDDATNGIGKPSRVKLNGQKLEEYFYDNKGRLIKTTYYRENKTYDITNTYNSTTGFLETKTHPNGIGIKYIYNSYGYLTEVRNKTTNVMYWKANGINVFDELTDFELGNGLKTSRSYAQYTRYLQSIRTGATASISSVQNDNYAFSAIGNLIGRRDLRNPLITKYETFDYDSLNRVTLIGQNWGGNYNSENITYDHLGNITYKSDVGVYNYEDASRPHLLTSLTNATNTAPCTFPFNQTVEYSSYNYVTKIANIRGDSIRFTYGPSRERIIQVLTKSGSQKWRKHYVGGGYEKSFYPNTAGGFVETIFIEAGGQVIAYIETTSRNQTTTRYLHHDHLGSVAVITKENGTIDKRYSYNAWGRQRDPDTWKNYVAPPEVPTNQRGFTFHEMLEIDFLICMNARVYDPVMGRFLSADSYVQFPDDLQSYNRYGYVMNNPLSYTDPTGHFSLRKFVGIVIGIAAIATGNAWLTGIFGNVGLAGAVISGATWGFGIAYVNTILSGGSLGDAFKNGLVGGFWGGVSAGLTYGIGHGLFGKTGIISQEYEIFKPIVHGAAQGTISVLRGGDFKSQFMAGLISSGAGQLSENFGVVGKAVIGGVTSKLSGGNFANGAVSAAFIELFNDQGDNQSKSIEDGLMKGKSFIQGYFKWSSVLMEKAGVGTEDLKQYLNFGDKLANPFERIAKGISLYRYLNSYVQPALDAIIDGNSRSLFEISITNFINITPLPKELKSKSIEGYMMMFDLAYPEFKPKTK
jgi:RHS repeat-associated protein